MLDRVSSYAVLGPASFSLPQHLFHLVVLGARLTWEAADQALAPLLSRPRFALHDSLSSRPFVPAHHLDEEHSVSGGL